MDDQEEVLEFNKNNAPNFILNKGSEISDFNGSMSSR